MRLAEAGAEEVCGVALCCFSVTKVCDQMNSLHAAALVPASTVQVKTKCGCVSKCEMKFGSSLNPAEMLGSRWLPPVSLSR